MQPLPKKKDRSVAKPFLLMLVTIATAFIVWAGLIIFENEKPLITIENKTTYLGKTAEISFSVADRKSGIRSIEMVIVQNEKEHVLFQRSYPRNGFFNRIGPQAESHTVEVLLEKKDLKEGKAELILKAKDYSLLGFFAGNTTVSKTAVTIDTIPPKIRLIHAERYISQGGSGIVVYQVSGGMAEHGVLFGGHFHKGHLVGDGRDDVYIAYIALPYDTLSLDSPKIHARDDAGNVGIVPFTPVLQRVTFKSDTIAISDSFLAAKIPEFEQHYPEMTGDFLEKYLYINSTIRQQNNEQIFQLCQTPSPERLWKDRFGRMAGASRAGFADHRTYTYNNKEIDRQVHLGMDIASTQRAQIKAANRGKVIFADYLGLYGNMVLLDHGQGVFSLYSHLSEIQVAVDTIVNTDDILGLTGTSGMAGGDHLHFSMLVNGIFVNPKEWWDMQWIQVTIDEPLTHSKF